MALSTTERKRLQRIREQEREHKEKQRRAAFDTTHEHLLKNFSSYADAEGGFSDFELPLEIAGIEPPTFFDERGPETFVLNDAMRDIENPFEGANGAVGRAEVMIDCLIDAASEMANIVNAYKKRELETRLDELAKDESIDRAQAISDATTITKKLDQLDKQVRRSFPQWRVTSE